MNTQLRCHKCDACNVVVVKREELEREAGAPLVGAAGFVSPEVIALILAAITVVLCKSCGFWEKM